ncbi:40s ribosomal protein sa-like, partial [Lynx pardinus]
ILAWEIVCMCGTVSHEHPWEVMPNLYFSRDPKETENKEHPAAEEAVTKEELKGEWTAPGLGSS